MGGFWNRVLHVDLRTGNVEAQAPGDSFFRRYMGGGLLGAYHAFLGHAFAADPLSPGNVLVFAPSVVTGAPVSGLGRHGVIARSPLTGGIADSQAGGYFGAGLKAAGVDAVVVTGRSSRPVYLVVEDGGASLVPADHIWGMKVREATEAITDELGEPGPVRVAAIGPAGENLVRFASIICDLRHTHGRGGLGAVMGSKNLKAVAVRATGSVPSHDPGAIRDLARRAGPAMEHNPMVQDLARLGSAGTVEYQNAAGGLPTRNWQAAEFCGAGRIGGAALDGLLVRRETCYGCVVRCKRAVRTGPPHCVDPAYGGPEYETLAALGSYLGVDDLEAVAKAHQLANAYGMDTISLGGTMAFAMECAEGGLLPSGDWPAPHFGSPESMLSLMHLIATRTGIGDLLAQGSRLAATRLGGRAPELAMHVRGLELPAHMPQAKGSLSLTYLAAPTGADHVAAEHDEAYFAGAPAAALEHLAQLGLHEPGDIPVMDEAKFRFAFTTHIYYSLLDTLAACMYCWGPMWLYSPADLVEAVRAATGWNTSLYELMRAGERRLVLMHAFNSRAGMNAAECVLPGRFFREVAEGSPRREPLDAREVSRWHRLYCDLMGIDPGTGAVSESKLAVLGLEWTADVR